MRRSQKILFTVMSFLLWILMLWVGTASSAPEGRVVFVLWATVLSVMAAFAGWRLQKWALAHDAKHGRTGPGKPGKGTAVAVGLGVAVGPVLARVIPAGEPLFVILAAVFAFFLGFTSGRLRNPWSRRTSDWRPVGWAGVGREGRNLR